MVSARPLAGRRVVITRAASQAPAFVRLLVDAGADVIEAPTIAIEPPADWSPLDRAIAGLDAITWVVFTSVNGVTMFEERLLRAGRAWADVAARRVAAIGPATAAVLAERGVATEVVPEEYRAEGLAASLAPLLRRGDRILLPRAAETRDVLVRSLEALGAEVNEVPAYRTRRVTESAERLRAELARGAVDVVTFTSSSTARNFAALFGDDERRRLLQDVAIASIGPITADTAAAFGLRTQIMPDEYTIPALARAIASHFAGRPAPERS
jgi:uroporphyrinogen III methyltransferase/synthase